MPTRQRLNGCLNGGKARNDGSLAQQPVARCVRRRDRRRRCRIRTAAACSNALRGLVRRAFCARRSADCEPVFVRRIGARPIPSSVIRTTSVASHVTESAASSLGLWLAIAWAAGIALQLPAIGAELSPHRADRPLRHAVNRARHTDVRISSLITSRSPPGCFARLSSCPKSRRAARPGRSYEASSRTSARILHATTFSETSSSASSNRYCFSIRGSTSSGAN